LNNLHHLRLIPRTNPSTIAKMRSFTILAIVTATMSMAKSIPEGAPDGLYISSIRPKPESGASAAEIAAFVDDQDPELLFEFNATEASTLTQRAPLPIDRTECFNGLLDRANYLQARGIFTRMCENGEEIGKNSRLGFKVGSSLVYACNWGGGSQGCSKQEVDDAMIALDENCGGLIGGWVNLKDWAKGYGRTDGWANPCNW
jgi:hypothetical protein